MKNRKFNIIIIILMTGFMLWYLLKDNYSEIIDSLFSARYIWIIIAIGLSFLYTFFEAIVSHYITRMHTDKIPFKFHLYLMYIGRFISGITPLASGGQPVQVYELHKKGVSVTNSTNIIIQSFTVFRIALIFICIITIILNKVFNLFANVPVLYEMIVAGFILNFGLLLILFLISFSKNFNRIIIKFGIKVLAKLKLIKNKQKQLEKWNKLCDEYYENSKVLLKNKKVLFKCLFYETLGLLCFFAVPFVLLFSLKIGNTMTWYASLSAAVYVYIAGSYIPIPGATGGMEYAFLGIFGNFILGYQLNTMLVLWRFATYYLPVVFGGVLFGINTSRRERQKIEKNK